MNKHIANFMRMGASYGTAMGVFFYMQYRQPVAAAIGVLSGIPFGASMAYVGWRREKKLLARGFTVSDMKPTQVRQIQYPAQQGVTLEAARSALNAIRNVRDVTVDPGNGAITAKTGMTWKSFGETIQIRVEPAARNALVTITSEPRFTSTRTDWGKGVENVEAFSQALRALAATVSSN